MSTLQHANLVRMHGVTNGSPRAIVMEFVEGGDLFYHFHQPSAALEAWREYEKAEKTVKANSDRAGELSLQISKYQGPLSMALMFR